MAAFHEQLRRLRETVGFTQEGLARTANLSLSTITKLERGGMDPSWSTVQRLARALGTTCEAFADCKDVAAEAEPKKARRKRKRTD
jgi:predicted transcriptional regulator